MKRLFDRFFCWSQTREFALTAFLLIVIYNALSGAINHKPNWWEGIIELSMALLTRVRHLFEFIGAEPPQTQPTKPQPEDHT